MKGKVELVDQLLETDLGKNKAAKAGLDEMKTFLENVREKFLPAKKKVENRLQAGLSRPRVRLRRPRVKALGSP